MIINPYIFAGLVGTVFDVKTDNTGTSNNDQFTLPISSLSGLTFDWGDGDDTSEFTHTYASAGTYTITITGTVGVWTFSSGADKSKLIHWRNCGDVRVQFDSFRGCDNLILWTATDAPEVTTTTLSACFRDTGLVTITGLGLWDIGSVNAMQDFLRGSSSFTGIGSGIENLDVSSVDNFKGCFQMTILAVDISGWDMSNATTIAFMFFDATGVDLPLGSWNLSSALTNCDSTFRGTSMDDDFGGWVWLNVTTGNNFLLSTTMSTANWNATLAGIIAESPLNNTGWPLNGGNATPSGQGITDRGLLEGAPDLLVITDGDG